MGGGTSPRLPAREWGAMSGRVNQVPPAWPLRAPNSVPFGEGVLRPGRRECPLLRGWGHTSTRRGRVPQGGGGAQFHTPPQARSPQARDAFRGRPGFQRRAGVPGPSPELGGPSSSAMVPAPGAPGPGGKAPDLAASESPSPGRSGSGSKFSSPTSFSRPQTASPGSGGSPPRRAGRGGMAAAAWLEAGLARVLFYPTLLYTLFRGNAPGRAHREWYHRMDRTVLLGALPLRSMTHRVSEAGDAAGPRGKRGRSARPGPRCRPGDTAAPPPWLSSPLFASAAGTRRERARGGHHERGV